MDQAIILARAVIGALSGDGEALILTTEGMESRTAAKQRIAGIRTDAGYGDA